jgi:hypothetical protein
MPQIAEKKRAKEPFWESDSSKSDDSEGEIDTPYASSPESSIEVSSDSGYDEEQFEQEYLCAVDTYGSNGVDGAVWVPADCVYHLDFNLKIVSEAEESKTVRIDVMVDDDRATYADTTVPCGKSTAVITAGLSLHRGQKVWLDCHDSDVLIVGVKGGIKALKKDEK